MIPIILQKDFAQRRGGAERRAEKKLILVFSPRLRASARAVLYFLCILGFCRSSFAADKPKVAVFPLGGDAPQALRDRVGFSIRAKLDRGGIYDPIDGPAMQDLADAAQSPLNFDTSADAIQKLVSDSGAVVLVWGDVSVTDGGKTLIRLHMLDLREKSPAAHDFTQTIDDEIQVRFVVEKFLETFPGIGSFQHPNEEAVHHDPVSDALFARNPNMVIDGDFSQSGRWTGIYTSDQYPVPVEPDPPAIDKVGIYRDGQENVLAMYLSETCAANNGLACLSEPIEIAPGARYRITFRYRSEGPVQHVFVKGYTLAKSISGTPEDREIYRLQVSPSGGTGDKWKFVEADLNPYNPNIQVQRLRVDLYAYLNPGKIEFSNIQLKAVGRQDQPATAPAN
jgi:hypothetical protein